MLYKKTKILAARLSVTYVFISLANTTIVHADPIEGRKARSVALMAALGDSLTAGTLSDTTIIESDDHKKPGLAALVVLQDILLGVGANHHRYSWASGKQINSHYLKLKDWMSVNEPEMDLEVANFAVPGVKAPKFNQQAERLVKALESGRYDHLKYVTVTIGGNDICLAKKSRKMTEIDVFQESMRKFFRTLASIRQNEPIRVLVSSIPNAPSLGRAEFLGVNVLGGYTCEWVRTYIRNSCQNLNTFTTEDEYQTMLETVVKQNEMLRALTNEAAIEYPNLQTFYSDAVFNMKVTPDMLGYDCFHPSKRGQNVISELTFQDQPFFK